MPARQNLTGVPEKVRSPAGCQNKSPGQGQIEMYFESVEHKIKQVQTAKEAAELIHSGKVLSYEAITWKNENGEFFAVSDTHIDDIAFGETAILKKENNLFYQIESITSAWVKTPEELTKIFEESETDEPIKSKASLIIGKATTEKANFTCGCCGDWFHSSVSKQLKFNQDSSYGICPKCEQFYA
jgi:Zn finger protein HypA/HybF involved in hydrogenase expression